MAVLLEHFVKTDESLSAYLVVTEELHAFLTSVYSVNHDRIEEPTSSGNGTVILVIDGTKITQSTGDTRETTCSLGIHQTCENGVFVPKLSLGILHHLKLLTGFLQLLLFSVLEDPHLTKSLIDVDPFLMKFLQILLKLLDVSIS